MFFWRYKISSATSTTVAGNFNKVVAVILAAFGAVVIGLVDNLLRPILVGRDTKLPDYVVLYSTLGGLALFGITGFALGPLLAGLFVAFWQIFIQEFNTEPADVDIGPTGDE